MTDKIPRPIWDLACVIYVARKREATGWLGRDIQLPDYDSYTHKRTADFDLAIACAKAVLADGYSGTREADETHPFVLPTVPDEDYDAAAYAFATGLAMGALSRIRELTTQEEVRQIAQQTYDQCVRTIEPVYRKGQRNE